MKPITANGISACQQCGRLFGKEMVACSDRARGGCPFACESRSRVARIIGAGAMLLGIYLILGAIRGAFELGALLMGALLALVGFVGALGSHMVLCDSESRVRWECNWLLGLEYGETLTVAVPVSTLPWPAPASVRLIHPASHIAFYRYWREEKDIVPKQRHEFKRSSAAALFQAAFADLLSRELIQAQSFTQYRSTGRKVSEEKKRLNLFSPGPRRDAADELPASAWLEKSLLCVVNFVDARALPPGAVVYDLVRAVFETDKGDPEGWPLQMVGKELMHAGLARRTGFRRQLMLSPDVLLQLECEQGRLDDLTTWFHGDGGVEETTFLSEVGRAIASRQSKNDDSWH